MSITASQIRASIKPAAHWVSAALLLLAMSAVRAEAIAPVQAMVITPEASGPASVIYDKVVAGIRRNQAIEVLRLTLPRDANLQWLQEKVDAHQHNIVIAIGNQSYRLCEGLQTPSTVVAGGISGKPNGIPTLSLTGDAATALAKLKQLAPEVKDLRVVYSEPMNGWWYEQARLAGASFGIEVHGYHAKDLKDGVRLYEKMVDEAEPRRSAIWIPLRSIVPSKTILPFLLEKAWAKKLPVVSNNPSHTRLGGLMALYPEHESMGAQLAEFALAHHRRTAGVDRIAGTSFLRLAVNVRTGAHIGLRFSAEDRAGFDKVFPDGR